MLPDRSKRYAGLDGEIPRLRLTSPGHLLLIALLMAVLLTAIFPHRALVEQLYERETLDELTVAYIHNLHRTAPDNADLAILLARADSAHLTPAQVEQLVGRFAASGDARQRAEARLLLLAAGEQTLAAAPTGAEAEQRRQTLRVLLDDAAADEMPPRLLGVFAAAAYRFGHYAAGDVLLRRLGSTDVAALLERHADEALAAGRYRLAAEQYLLARREARQRADARRLFQAGIGAYLADSRHREAMQAADRHLGDLANDAPTLRYLVRSALASADPARAAKYAQLLVFGADQGGRP